MESKAISGDLAMMFGFKALQMQPAEFSIANKSNRQHDK